MYTALITILSALPEETKVFCGHEYTLQNLKFAKHVEPTNEQIEKKMEWTLKRRQNNLPSVCNFFLKTYQYRILIPGLLHIMLTAWPVGLAICLFSYA